jgi:hypothetical protein
MLELLQGRCLLRALLLVCPVILALSACGSDGQGNDSDDTDGGGGQDSGGAAGSGATTPTSEAERFRREYAAAVCVMYEPCCHDEELGFDASGCTEWFAEVTEAYFPGEYSPEGGAACLTALEEARTADPDRCRNVGLFDDATLRDLCREAFDTPSRTGADLGESCLLAGDCATSDEGPVICSGGTCLLNLRGADGDGPCATPDRPPTVAVRCEAEDGLYCHRGDNVCRPRVGDGEPCPYPGACDDTALCTGGMCHGFPEHGEPCLNAVPGAGGFCAPRSVCDVATLTCAPGLENGTPCQDPNDCASGVCADDTCKASDFESRLNCTG